jgi:serine/threonine protein kinase
MSLTPGGLLQDKTTQTQRFRITELLCEGRSYFVALGEDTHLDGMKVVLKSIRYEEDNPSADTIAQRRGALKQEMEALTLTSPLLPEPIDWLEIESELAIGGATEPVLVQEYINGKNLRDELGPSSKGMDPARALGLIHELALALDELHGAGWALRDFDPSHILLGYDDILHLVGVGNMSKLGERPIRAKLGVSARYSAPEIRAELSGKFITPASDLYGLGALLSFLLTGCEPNEQVEGPLTSDAYARLLTLPEGYRLVVARCLQPMAKHRPKSVQALLPYLDAKHLPTRQTKGFEEVQLPLPFERNQEAVDNRATRSKISVGPLLSVPKGGTPSPDKPSDPAPPPPPSEALTKPPAPWYKGCLPWLGMLLALGGMSGALVYAFAV